MYVQAKVFFLWVFICGYLTTLYTSVILFSSLVCRGSVYRALGLMVAASPCALAVAPLVYATAISACARKVFVIAI